MMGLSLSLHSQFLSIFFLFLFITTITCTDIPLGSTLHASNLTQSWSSPNNTFSLSFLTTTDTTPNSFIAAVSYGGIPIWQAGAAVDSSATLQLLSSGNLVLISGEGTTVWESNTTGLNVSVATLEDSGEFVLKRANEIVWSSFDEPTDTIVPSQNFGVDSVLRNGLYSFRIVRSGNLTLRWNDSIEYWTKGNSSFDRNLTSPRLGMQSIGILNIVDEKLPSPLTVVYSNDYGEGSDVFRFLKLNSDGNLRIYSSDLNSGVAEIRWSAVLDQCQVFGYCGNMGICSYNASNPVCGCPSKDFDQIDPNDSKKGCKRKMETKDCVGNATMLDLNNAQFLTFPPETSGQEFFVAISACKSNCLSNPSCDASTSLSDGTGLCYLKTPSFMSGYQSPALPSTSYVKVCGPGDPNTPPSEKLGDDEKDSKLHLWIVALVVIGTLLALILLELGIWWWCCRVNSKLGGLSTQYALLEYASGAPVQFSYKELQRATKGFKEKLGEGGFGAVYRGILSNRSIVAVKQLEGIEQGEKQFRMEVATISSTHHLNLVRLMGYCSEGRHRLLVYEFMKNGSLDNFLFMTENSGKLLGWDNRFTIALGTARGITYLHEECRDCIVHCDIKPENILVDENYNAKVSDFGLAKLVNPKDHRYRTLTSVRGTRGYLAPEWLANLPITSKSDVYSFGMVLLEIVGGRRNFEISDETSRRKFSTWAYEEFEKGNIVGIVDKRLANQVVDIEQVRRVVQVSFWCIQEQPSHRPTMGKVVQMLEGVTAIGKPPAPKSLTDGSVSGSSVNAVTFATSAPTTSSSSSLQIASSISSKNVEKGFSSILESEYLSGPR